MRCAIETQHVALRLRRERCLADKGLVVTAAAPTAVALDQPVRAPGLLVEEIAAAQAHAAIHLPRVGVVREKAVEVDPDILEELLGRLVVPLGRLDIERAAVQRQRPSVVLKLVALGVSAEVVVVVEDEHPGAPTEVLDKEVRRGEPADTAANDH